MGMSHVMSVCEQDALDAMDEGIDRSKFRLTTFADEPVSLLLNLDGVEIDPVVERLDVHQASFVCPKDFELFYEGQMLGPAVLILQDKGLIVVNPVVKSKNWPTIDVEFMEVPEKDRRVISGFLAASSGGFRPPINRRAVASGYGL